MITRVNTVKKNMENFEIGKMGWWSVFHYSAGHCLAGIDTPGVYISVWHSIHY